ncbi:MAG: LTA synthase family protein [Thermoanaerobaculales bacterium]
MTLEIPGKTIARVMLPFVVFVAIGATWVIHAGTVTLEPQWTQALTELPLLLYLFALLRAPLRRRWWRSLAAGLPFAWVYAVHDYYFLSMGTVPDFVDFKLLPDLLRTMGLWRRAGTIALLALPLVVWLLAVDWKRRQRRWRYAVAALPLVLLVGAIVFAPGPTYELAATVTSDEQWADAVTAQSWGRVYTLLMREARRGNFRNQLRHFTPLDHSPLELHPDVMAAIQPRNVHLVVLEGFLDVRLLRGVTFSQPPLGASFTNWADGAISSSISPAFGGETARAEFELLCGVPSLRAYGVEYLAFSGAQTYCLANILSQAGYRTVVSFPGSPLFFNSRRAYAGLGFQQTIYGDRFTPGGQESIRLSDEPYLFDGDLYDQNLAKVTALVRERRPFFNYVVTMCGHWPFEFDTDRHPIRIEVDPDEEDLKLITNLTYHRAEALHAFVTSLVKIDPHGVIVLVADHLPPLPQGVRDYRRLGYQGRSGLAATHPELLTYENFLLAIVDGKPHRLPLMRHFDVPHWILDQLSGGVYCREQGCDFGRLPVDADAYLDRYRTILGLAVGP